MQLKLLITAALKIFVPSSYFGFNIPNFPADTKTWEYFSLMNSVVTIDFTSKQVFSVLTWLDFNNFGAIQVKAKLHEDMTGQRKSDNRFVFFVPRFRAPSTERDWGLYQKRTELQRRETINASS